MYTLIFDVDGVVFYGADRHGQYHWRKNIEADLGITQEHIASIYHTSAWEQVIRGKRDIKDHLQYVFESFPYLRLTPDQYLAYWQSHDTHINPEIVSLLSTLGMPAYLGTNQDPLRTAHIENVVGHHFKGIFSSSSIGHAKPEPEFYRHIEKTLYLQPEQLILIDDTAHNIAGAKARGWNTFFFQDNINALQFFLDAMDAKEGV